MARPCSGGIVVASPTERLIIETLSRLVPAAAVSYEQCLLDLSQGQRRSYRGAEPAPPPVWFQKKRTPALRGPGSFAGWGEGLGAGGTPIRHYPGQRGDSEAVPAMRARAGALDTGGAASTTGRLLILKEGAVAVVKEGVEIARVTEPGAVFGELSALLDQPHTADVRALEASQFHVADAATTLRVDPIFFTWRPCWHSVSIAPIGDSLS